MIRPLDPFRRFDRLVEDVFLVYGALANGDVNPDGTIADGITADAALIAAAILVAVQRLATKDRLE